MADPDPTAAGNRSQRRRTRTRAALIGAAREVFAERGIAIATIQEIADTADVAKGSFYNHFDSREAILRAVVGQTLEELGAALDREVEPETDPARVVAKSLLCTLQLASADPILGGFLLQASDAADVSEAAIGARARRDLLRGRAEGRFVFEHLEVVLAALGGAAIGVLRRRLHGDLGAVACVQAVALAMRALGVPAQEASSLAASAAAELETG